VATVDGRSTIYAPAVREDRRAALSRIAECRSSRSAPSHSGASAARLPRPARERAGAAGRGAQGLLHGSRAMGAAQGFEHLRVDGAMTPTKVLAAAQPLSRAQHRAAGGRVRGHGAQRGRAAKSADRALDYGKGTVYLAPVRAGKARPRRPRRRRRSRSSARAPGAGAALPNSIRGCVLVQLQTWLVPALLRTASWLAGFDAEQTGERSGGTSGGRARAGPVPRARASGCGPRRWR